MQYVEERIKRLLQELETRIYPIKTPVSGIRMKKTREQYDPSAGINTTDWEACPPEPLWGGHREYFWFSMEVDIPETFAGMPVEIEVRTGREEPREKGEEWGWDALNPQFTAFVNGRIVQGLDINHRDILLTEQAKGGEYFTVVLSAFTGDQNPTLKLDCRLKARDVITEKYFYDLEVPYKILRLLERDDKLYLDMVRILNQSLDFVEFRYPYSAVYTDSIHQADIFLEENYYQVYQNRSIAKAYCVGHTHIDVAWKWTLSVTRDKALRSFSTVLELMDRYPQYRFMSSQPQLYKYVKEQSPAQFERIRSRVADDRWEPEGAMFLEADVVLTSGESLVRQIQYGKKFFREEFGRDSRVLWMPDVFGYTAALPQIMKQSGVDYFMTTKIGWNEKNCFPYDTFWWEGLDGTKVLTHMSPARDYMPSWADKHLNRRYTTYNAYMAPSHLMGGWQRYQQKDLNDSFLVAFGFGDGGGGPTREELENEKRLMRGLAGCPQVVPCTSLEFFRHLEKQVAENPRTPEWVGELYLEFHRGIYTSMARNKRSNRKSEILISAVESGRTMTQLLCGQEYPQKELDACWEILLRNQFHDILPGSAIHEVYEDSAREYAALSDGAAVLEQEAMNCLVREVDAAQNSVLVYNPSGTAGKFLCSAKLPDNCALIQNGSMIPTQRAEDGSVIWEAELLPKGYQTFGCTTRLYEKVPCAEYWQQAEKSVFENDFFRIELNAAGRFTRLYDKTVGREVLQKGLCGNRLVCYEDIPARYDCWNIDQSYEEKYWEVDDLQRAELTENGPVRAVLKLHWRWIDSDIIESVILYKNIARIDLQYEVDWRQHQMLLKNLFPLDIHTHEATYEIQFGNIKRPTHRNTSWEQAAFEVWTHKWMDLSEEGYGVSFLNDCKYGVSVKGTLVGLTLLKSGVFPNETADQEHHSFTFALLPHKGNWKQAGTVAEAYRLNTELWIARKPNEGGVQPPQFSMAESLNSNIVLETIKQAEDGQGVIVRLYECHNRRTKAAVRFGFKVCEAELCNLQEQTKKAAEICGQEVRFEAAPYEIITLRIKFDKEK